MSHIVTSQVQVKNLTALAAAIARLEKEGKQVSLIEGGKVMSHRLYGGAQTGVGIRLPGWSYPVVIDMEKGVANYDNYNGRWGNQLELDALIQSYSVEVAREQANAEGYTFVESRQENGDLEVIMESY